MPNNFNRNRRPHSYRPNPPELHQPFELPSDVPPQETHSDSFPKPNPLTNLKLDTDTLIVLALVYLLYKDDTSREHFKLILALGYILL